MMNRMLERLVDGEFLGMHMDEICAVLMDRDLEAEIADGDFDEAGYIILGNIYGEYYTIDFVEWHCVECYHNECEA